MNTSLAMSSDYYSQHKLRLMNAGHAYPRHHRLSVGAVTPRGSAAAAASASLDASTVDMSSTMGKLIREFLVTYTWMLFGWLVMTSPFTDDFWAPALGFGVTHYVLLESFRTTSANPLISFVNIVFNNSQGERAAFHWGAIGMQLAAALTAAWTVNSMVQQQQIVWAVVQPLPNVTDTQVLFMEAVIAFGYAWLYLTLYRTPNDDDTPIIATASPSLVLGAYWFISTAATNGSLHPWRQLAAAIVAGVYTKCWLYIAADFVGFVIGCIAFISVFSRKG